MTRVYNFAAGPSTFPAAVLNRARDELLEWGDTGMSVMEMSHCGKAFIGIAEKAEAKMAGLVNLEGHSSVGGLRASIYNAMPEVGVAALVAFMGEFERSHG